MYSRRVDVFEAVRARQEELRVPGVAVGVLQDGEERHEAFGVTSVDNPLDVTPETRFQIGSISKTFTGTAVMYLVAEGAIDLDRPVRNYLPDLELGDADATERVTMRHLLAHTGGWAGDYFDDTGWGDDAVARFVERMRTLPQLTTVGELWSVQQRGVRAGGARRRDRHRRALRGRRDATRPRPARADVDDVLAVGGDDRALRGRPRRGGRRGPRRAALAGRPLGPPRGRPHLDHRRPVALRPPAPRPAAGLAPMQEPQADAAEEGEWVGLTWYGDDRLGTIRHGGGTMGQLSMLVLQPRSGFALAVLTNHSPNGLQVIDAALEASGLKGPDPDELHDAPVGEYAGAYETQLGRVTVTPDGGRIRIELEPAGGFPNADTPPMPAPPPMTAFFYTRDRWIVDGGPFDSVRGHFMRTDTGDISWLRLGGRLYRRVSE